MDFSRIPFNSALDRFGHLLPIGPFIRLQTVVPNFRKMILEKRYFHTITVEQSSTAFLSITFDTSLTVHFDSPEAVLNDRVVNCLKLELNHVDGVPAEAISCDMDMHLRKATPSVFPFLKCGPRFVQFLWREIDSSQTSVTFEAVMAHVGPNVKSLIMPWLDPEDSADITQFEAPQDRNYRLEYFEMPFSTFEHLTEWLRRNAHAMAHNRFCKLVTLYCESHKITDAKAKKLEKLAHPYCSHRFGHDECVKIGIHFSNAVLKFYFVAQKPCSHCPRLSNKN